MLIEKLCMFSEFISYMLVLIVRILRKVDKWFVLIVWDISFVKFKES